MNANAKFLEEAKMLEKKWDSQLLKGVEKSRRVTAVMLESQRLINELPGPANYWLHYHEMKGL